ncbi:MAG: hypothetical protein U5J96_07360 [Ignavibacteriaceae bacterium]|nr:hypothetical protein [Ignavibacteriaceae bacterium]
MKKITGSELLWNGLIVSGSGCNLNITWDILVLILLTKSYTWEDMDGNTTVITNGADYAAYIGIVVVNSAGNEGYNSSA